MGARSGTESPLDPVKNATLIGVSGGQFRDDQDVGRDVDNSYQKQPEYGLVSDADGSCGELVEKQ